MTVTVHPQFRGSWGLYDFPPKNFATLLNDFHADFSIWLSRSSNFASPVKALIWGPTKILSLIFDFDFIQNRNIETLPGGYERSAL